MIKKIIIIASLISTMFGDYSINKYKLPNNPVGKKFLSFENGGNRHAIDAYSDGIGMLVVPSATAEFVNNSLMNTSVFTSGQEAKDAGITLKEYLEKTFGIGSGNNIEIIKTIENVGSVNIGDPCDDRNEETYNDIYVDNHGTCLGILSRTENKCLGDTIGSEIVVNGITHLVVDNEIIKDNLNRAETLCTSNVTDMSFLFSYKTSFNQNINSWDVSNVTNMNYMFFGASLFNQPLNNWNTSHVTTMEGMFYKATSFNQNIRNWNISNVTTSNLFDIESGLENLNKPIF